MFYYVTPRFRPAQGNRMNPFFGMQNQAEECDYSFPADIVSTPDAFEIRAMIPGIAVDGLDIQFAHKTVTIKGEYPVHESENMDMLRSELPEGKFSRQFKFGEPIDSEKAEATLKDGILTLRVPKAEEAKPRSIKVKAE